MNIFPIPFPTELSHEESMVYRMIYEAAELGDPCPVNIDLEEAAQYSSCSMGSKVVRKLESKGYLVVERSQKARRCQITATGKWTAWPAWHRAKPTRIDRGAHDDSFLIAALVELGLKPEDASARVKSLAACNRLSKDLDRVRELVGRRVTGFLVGRV